MFLITTSHNVHISFFLNFQAYFLLGNSTLALTSKNSCNEYFVEQKQKVNNSCLLQTSNVWQQNMSPLHPIRACFFFTCICLGVTNGSCENLIIKNKAFSLWCSLLEFLLSNVLIMYWYCCAKTGVRYS